MMDGHDADPDLVARLPGLPSDAPCVMFFPVRTTVDIEDDVLQAAREIAASRGQTIGQVLSDLARRSLQSRGRSAGRNGVPMVPRRPNAQPMTVKRVNELRDDE